MNLIKVRDQIFQEAKPHIISNGWNEDLFNKISKFSKFNYNEINCLFPMGYVSMLEIYLEEINKKMTKSSKNLNLKNLKTHERIRELLILRLNIMLQEKKLVSKTFFYLLFPYNFKLATASLYKTVDLMWFLAEDNSTDFNFYTKRSILASIYLTTLIHFINNNNLQETIDVLDKQLFRVSKIPIIKKKTKKIFKKIPDIYKISKKFSLFRQ